METGSPAQKYDVIKYLSDVNTLSNLRIEKGFFIASFPLVGYLIGYLYRLTYFDFFNISNLFVRVGLEEILVSTSLVVATSFVIGIIIFLLLFINAKISHKKITPEVSKPSFKEALTVFAIISISIAILFFFLLSFSLFYKVLLIFIAISFISLITFVMPYLYFPEEESFAETFRKYQEKVYLDRLKKQGRANIFARRFGFLFIPPYFGYTLYIIVVGIFMLISSAWGQLLASNTESFFVLDTPSHKYILLGIYADQLLTSSLDDTNTITGDDINLLPLTSMKDFRYQYTGRINAYKTSQKQH